jgi:glutamate racemase
VSEHTVLVDSAEATSAVVAATLEQTGRAELRDQPASREFLVTDDPDSFSRIGKRFLGHDIDRVQWVDLG